MITQQSANATKNMKIQPKPEPGMNATLPVVAVPKVNKGESYNLYLCVVFIF